MKILIAGSTGVIGRQLVPLLEAVGHEAVGLNRGGGVDLLDAAAVEAFVARVAPDAVVHLATAVPAKINPRKMTAQFATTNRLRTEGTANLVAAARAAGVRRIIVQGLAYLYRPGAGAADEDAAVWTDAPRQFRSSIAALSELERRTADAGGLVLRFGHLYGPGTHYDHGGSITRAVRRGAMPIVGDGAAVYSFTHTHDAATAIVSALDRDVTGALNVVDDHPAPVSEWLPGLAAMLDAPAPKRIPVTLARLAVGGWGVAFMNRLRGADNARARLELNWRPRHASWREGFAAELERRSAEVA